MPDIYPYGRDAPEGTYFAERRGGFDRGEGGPGEEWDPGSANNSAAAAAAAELARMWASAPFGTEPDTENWPGMYSAFHYATVAQNLIDDAFPPGTGTNGYYLVADDTMPSGVKWAAAPLFSDVASGMVPGSGGGTTNFLRADGTWASPAAMGGGAWGTITGDIADQLDLQTELSGKASSARTITAGTGLTGGGDLTGDRSLAFDTTWGDARYAQLVGGGYLPLSGGTMTGAIKLAPGHLTTSHSLIPDDTGWVKVKGNAVAGNSLSFAIEPNYPYSASEFQARSHDSEVQSGWDGGGFSMSMSANTGGAFLHCNKYGSGSYTNYRNIYIGWGPGTGLVSNGTAMVFFTNGTTGVFEGATIGANGKDSIPGVALRIQGGLNVVGSIYQNGVAFSPGATDLSYTAATRVLASSTGADATLPLFSSSDAGLTPASGGGTTNFLRADGTWAAPPGGSGATDLTYTASTRLLESSTGTDVTLPLVSSTDAGLAPASGGGTSNFLRADGTWAAPSGGASALDDLSDVVITTPSTGQVLKYNGTNWVNDTDATGSGATDLTYTASTRLLESSTGTDVTLPLVSSTDAGLAPASGGGTTNFLRADGTWAAPSGSGSPGGANTQIQFNDSSAFGGDADFTWNKTTNLLTVNGGGISLTGNGSRFALVTSNGTDGGGFTSNTTNATAILNGFPSGTGTASAIRLFNSSTPNWATGVSYAQFVNDTTYTYLDSVHSGGGSNALPMIFRTTTGGTTAARACLFHNGNWRFESGGNVTVDPSVSFYVHGPAQFGNAAASTIGIGKTASSSWNAVNALELGQGGSLWSNNAATNCGIAANIRFLTTTGWTYVTTAAGSTAYCSAGDWIFSSAASGTAGTAATVTERFRIVGSSTPRMQADFSNATLANRMAFQSSTTNGNTWVYATPNGTATGSGFFAANGALGANTEYFGMYAGSTEHRLESSGFGTGTARPIRVIVGGSTYATSFFATNGNVNIGAIGATDPGVKLYVDGATTVAGNLVVTGASIPQNSQSAAYTLVAADANKHILHPSADTTARTFTIPANSSVPYTIGTALTFVNQNGAGVVTIAITTDTMRLAGTGTTGSRTLAANGVATALKITATEWIISGTGLT